MKKNMLLLLCVLISYFIFISCHDPVMTEEEADTLIKSFYPVLDFYINRTWYTETNTLWGYGTDDAGTFTNGQTGSSTGNSGGNDYHNFLKLLFNFNISSLNGATIKSAYFRIYLYDIYKETSITPQKAKLENIFYGNTDSFPNPRNSDNEFGGYIVTPAISETLDASTTGWKFFDVKSKLQADIDAGRTNSQFRLTHENETDYIDYYFCNWYMADNATNKPELAITYTK